MRRLLGVTITLGALFFASVNASASSEKKSDGEGHGDPRTLPQVTASVLLQPTADSLVPIDELRIDYLSDGNRVVRGRISRTIGSANVLSEAFQYVIDPETSTYEAVPALSDQDLSVTPTFVADGVRTFKDPSPNLPPPGDGGCCATICAGSANGYVRTLDPAFIELTRTTAIGSWANNEAPPPGGCKWTSTGTSTCTAANPSPIFNTHWFTSSCQKLGPTSPPFYFDETVNGNYYNWDWLSASLRTDVAQSVTLHFDAPLFNFYWGHLDSGESSITIYGSAAYTIQDTCYQY